MAPIQPGTKAPPAPGVAFDGPTALIFYKVTCPVCQLAGPPLDRLRNAFPDAVIAVGQDPPEKLEAFAREWRFRVPAVSDPPPYPISDAYGIRTVPTVFLVDRDGTVLETVESWDREGFNRVSRRLAELTGTEYAEVFRPG